jgi:hypothetical protein
VWLHNLTRGLLDDLADNAGDEVEFDLYRSLYLFRQRMLALRPDWTDRSDPKTLREPEKMLSPSERRELARTDCFEAERAVWWRLVEELWALCQEPEPKVQRCAECKSPFLVSREGQRLFCSKRCGNRVSMRRARRRDSRDLSHQDTKKRIDLMATSGLK